MKILITVPRLYLKGGVANYFQTIRKYLSYEVDYFYLGAIKANETGIEKIKHLTTDVLSFHNLMRKDQIRYDLVHLNPSFNFGALIRDGIMLRIANSYGNKTLVFFRGFNLENVNIVDRFFRNIFFKNYNKADCFILLGSEFKDQLKKWRFNQPIFLETTIVDDEFAKSFSLGTRINRIKNRKNVRLLFLSRLIKEKGALETLQAFYLLSKKYSNLYLTIAGDGPLINQIRHLSTCMGLNEKITFPGYVTGEHKKEILLNSDIYVFPSHSEGMPNSILEAMAYGLPIVSTSVGGIKDFFVNGTNGFLMQGNTPESIVNELTKIIDNKEQQIIMSVNNYQSVTRFLASSVARRLENIYDKIAAQ